MKVKVFPPYGCKRSALDDKGWIELPAGTTLAQLLRRIGCSGIKAKILLVSINGERMPLNTALKDGDVVGFFAPISGG